MVVWDGTQSQLPDAAGLAGSQAGMQKPPGGRGVLRITKRDCPFVGPAPIQSRGDWSTGDWSASSGRSGATVLMGGILSSSPRPRTRLPDDRYAVFLIMPAKSSNPARPPQRLQWLPYHMAIASGGKSSCPACSLPEDETRGDDQHRSAY